MERRSLVGPELVRKLCLAAVAASLPLICLEAAVRVNIARQAGQQRSALALLGSAPLPDDGKDAELLHLLRPHPSGRIIYELRPDMETRFFGQPLTTDSRGFRTFARERPMAGEPVRILGIGDSVMFGWGVADGETYLAQLERALAERSPQTGWLTINTAVPGYNTAMEVETLAVKGLELRPDLVLLGWVNNDLDLPHHLRPYPSALSPDRSFLYEWTARRLRRPGTDPFSAPRIVAAGAGSREGTDESYLASLGAERRSLVGRPAFDRAVQELARLARTHSFEVIVFNHRDRAPHLVKEACSRLGFTLVNAYRHKKRFMRAQGIETEVGSSLTVSAADPHPSALGHRLLAEVLLESLEKRGYVRPLTPPGNLPAGRVEARAIRQ